MSFSKKEIIAYSALGGFLGAVAAVGVAGAIMHHRGKHCMYLPMTLEMQTNASAPSAMHVFAAITRSGGMYHQGKKHMVTLHIAPFKVMASGVFTAVSALPVLPVSCVPVADATPVDVLLHSADGKSTVKGVLSVSAAGAITITAPAPCADKDAWGLAEPAKICYEVADM